MLKRTTWLLNYRNACQSCRLTAQSSLVYHQRCSLWTSPQINAKSHYETLELKAGATQADIKSAYYRLSMKFHPDKNKGNEDKFKDISTAYEVLGNPRLRRLYDRGIISHDHDSSSQQMDYQDTGQDVVQSESAKESVRSFDQWSRNHTSETFSRQQFAKGRREYQDRVKEAKSAQTGYEVIIWLLGLSMLIFAYMNFKTPWDKSKKKS